MAGCEYHPACLTLSYRRFFFAAAITKDADTGKKELERHGAVPGHGFFCTIYQQRRVLSYMDPGCSTFRRIPRQCVFLSKEALVSTVFVFFNCRLYSLSPIPDRC